MTERALDHYELLVTAGPGKATVEVTVTYFDQHGQAIGTWGEGLFAFGTTWKDVAAVVRLGAERLEIFHDPVRAVTPMVDLT